MRVSLLLSLALGFFSNVAHAVVIVGYRGNDPNILEPYLPVPSQGELEINGDGASDLSFDTDGSLVAAMQSRNNLSDIS